MNNNVADDGQEAEEKQLCDICGQYIAKSSFRLHYMGCLRQKRVKQPDPPKKLEESKEDAKPVSLAQNVAKMNQGTSLGQVNPNPPAANSRINEEMEARKNFMQGSSLADDLGVPLGQSESNQNQKSQ